MRRGLTIAIAVVVGLAVVFLVGYSVGRGATLATVVIQNRSSHQIATAQVEYDQGMVVVSSIKARGRKNAVFFTRDRTDYRVLVTFDTGRTIRSDTRQVEPGAEVTEIVTDSVIVRAY